MTKMRLQNEIEHGKHLVNTWSGELKYWSSPAGKVRLKRRHHVLTDHVTPNMKILELGCGPGYFTKALAKTKAHITAIDISPDLLEFAKKNVDDENVIFEAENAYQLKYSDETFDSVIGNSVLHHLDIDLALKDIHRVLKKNGTIYFLEPNLLNPLQIIELSTPYFRKISQHSPDETAIIRWKLKKQLIQHGFLNVEILPFDFLHPVTPEFLIPAVSQLGFILEKVPILKEISGSLLIKANK